MCCKIILSNFEKFLRIIHYIFKIMKLSENKIAPFKDLVDNQEQIFDDLIFSKFNLIH